MRARAHLAAILFLLACLPAAATTAFAAPRIDGRQVAVPAADAQRFLEGNFPHRQALLGGLADVTVSQPQLTIPPGDRLRLGMDLALATLGGAPAPMGRLVLSSALRYDAAQRAFFLEQPRIEGFDPARGGGGLDDETRLLLDAWLADYARDAPVYRIDPALAALLGDLQVQGAGVADGSLVVTFNQDISAMAGALATPEE